MVLPISVEAGWCSRKCSRLNSKYFNFCFGRSSIVWLGRLIFWKAGRWMGSDMVQKCIVSAPLIWFCLVWRWVGSLVFLVCGACKGIRLGCRHLFYPLSLLCFYFCYELQLKDICLYLTVFISCIVCLYLFLLMESANI